jgi:hypothetical protein
MAAEHHLLCLTVAVSIASTHEARDDFATPEKTAIMGQQLAARCYWLR